MKIILIAAISLDGFIAANKDDRLTWTKDKNLFQKQTLDHHVAIGKRTLSLINSGLPNRIIVPIDRETNIQDLLKTLCNKTIFVAGGAETNKAFIENITHLYLTPHPLIFRTGIKLFGDKNFTQKTRLEKIVSIEGKENLKQYQFKVINH